MAEITNIHLTDEAFDKMLKNIQSGGIFVPNKEENSDLKLENDNPTTDELQSRVRSLYERFLKFKEDEKQLGIKKIEFEYPNFENQIKQLLSPQPNYKTLVTDAENTMARLEDSIAFVKSATDTKTNVDNAKMRKHLLDVISKLDKNMKQQLIADLKQLQK